MMCSRKMMKNDDYILPAGMDNVQHQKKKFNCLIMDLTRKHLRSVNPKTIGCRSKIKILTRENTGLTS